MHTYPKDVDDRQKHAICRLIEQLDLDLGLIERLVRERYQVWLDDLDQQQRANIIRKLSAAVQQYRRR